VDGLEAGEIVVIHGALRARHDQEVKVIAMCTGDETLEELLQQGIGGPTK
jgi:hypothetical protein